MVPYGSASAAKRSAIAGMSILMGIINELCGYAVLNLIGFAQWVRGEIDFCVVCRGVDSGREQIFVCTGVCFCFGV